jgi:hypothetical protein
LEVKDAKEMEFAEHCIFNSLDDLCHGAINGLLFGVGRIFCQPHTNLAKTTARSTDSAAGG